MSKNITPKKNIKNETKFEKNLKTKNSNDFLNTKTNKFTKIDNIVLPQPLWLEDQQ